MSYPPVAPTGGDAAGALGSLHQQRLRQLLEPPPASFPLVAALHLLQPRAAGQTAYLLDRAYLENWLCWALHQRVPAAEEARRREAVRLAAQTLGLVPPFEGNPHREPGPVDSSRLAMEGHPLLLSPFVRLHKDRWQPSPPPARGVPRVRSAPSNEWSKTNGHGQDPLASPSADDSTVVTEERIECVAVSEAFYETLRTVHGVVCDDGYAISFQPGPTEQRVLLHHTHAPQSPDSSTPKPIEFRRKIIRMRQRPPSRHPEPASLMDKLLLEESERVLRENACAVEVHPLKLTYNVVDEGNVQQPFDENRQDGFVLVSRDADASDALSALMRVVEPRKASLSVRLWSQHDNGNATRIGDGFELVDFDSLEERSRSTGAVTHLTIQDWVERHSPSHTGKGIHILVESRKTVNSPWPRHQWELLNRIQVGDLIDAQDVAEKWYEAIVRHVDADSVTVHYVGWASRWDTRIKRRHDASNIERVNTRIACPAPLWTRTKRWRERIRVGDIVEVRDASSLVHRPKWYKGEVKSVGSLKDPIRELVGGAVLEAYTVEGSADKKEHLIMLQRTQQVFLQVDQERNTKAGNIATSLGEGDLAAGINPQPPFLRWVNLYGEEICLYGTHLRIDSGTVGPVTIRYETDGNRKPVEVLNAKHPMLGAGFMRESLRGVPPGPGSVGFQNLGNSCYMNSVLQCLNHIDPLTQYFLNDKYADELNTRNPLGSGGNVAQAYASLLKRIWSGEFSILAPRSLKQTVAAFAPQFDNSYQHDSHEFCQFLMDGLHEDLNRVKTKPYVEELEGRGMEDAKAAIDSWRKHLLRHDSIIVDHCQGMYRNHLTCPRCGRESIKFEVFSSISLPLVQNKHRTVIQLEDCLEKFMEGEQLDERNAWYCPMCRQHVCALKMIALWTVPDVLILHLKRFTFDHCMPTGNMVRYKMDDTVEFPIEKLDMTKHLLGPVDKDNPPVYRLFGVSEHVGPTANSGHYTATVRNSIDNQWYRYNDSHVGRTSGEASILGGAYLLFYVRAKGGLRWGGMEKIMKELDIDPYGGLEIDQEGFQQVRMKKKKKGEDSSRASRASRDSTRTARSKTSRSSKASRTSNPDELGSP